MKFIITVDTEADGQWARPETITLENIKHLGRFQALCDRYGFRPTYLASYEVADSSVFLDIAGPFLESGRAEIGAHLHPWSCPPFESVTPDDMRHHPYPHELPLGLFRAKMENLTTRLEREFTTQPRTYRGGRWGFAPDQIDVLLDLGYVVDCSVTPNVSWERHLGDPKGKGGPDWRKAPLFPYFLNPDDACKPGNSHLLEVPTSILFTKLPFARNIFLANDRTIVARALAKLGLGPEWLRPYPHMSVARLIGVCQKARRLGLPHIQMMLHSSELMPGGSPYNPDENSIEYLYRRLERLFEHLRLDGVQGLTMSEFASYHDSAQGGSSAS